MSRPYTISRAVRSSSRRAPTPLTEQMLRKTVGLATGWFLARVVGLDQMVGQ